MLTVLSGLIFQVTFPKGRPLPLGPFIAAGAHTALPIPSPADVVSMVIDNTLKSWHITVLSLLHAFLILLDSSTRDSNFSCKTSYQPFKNRICLI